MYPEPVVTSQRTAIVDLEPSDNEVAAVSVQFLEVDIDVLQELVPGVFEIMQVLGVIDDALQVTFIVANRQLEAEMRYALDQLGSSPEGRRRSSGNT